MASKNKSADPADFPKEITIMMPGKEAQKVKVTKVVDLPRAVHYYYTDPVDKKEKRVIRLKARGVVREL